MNKLTACLSAALLCAAGAMLPTHAQAQDARAGERWEFAASVYLWFPSLGGQSVYPPSTGGSSISIDVGDILENLHFAFMGTFEARRGAWGVFSDLVYMDIGAGRTDTRSFEIGGVALPADVSADTHLDMVGGAWSLGGSWRAISTPAYALDLVGGARLLDIENTLRWTLRGNVGAIPLPDRAGERSARLENWDAFVGAKGRYRFGDDRRWFVPWYVDVGAGDSELTTQAMAGVGYTFAWGDAMAGWRYVGYRFKSGGAFEELSFNGAMASAVFRW